MADKIEFTGAAPVLPVDDTVATIEYYRDVLGFKVEAMRGKPPHYAVVRRGAAVIHFSEREDTTDKIKPCSVNILVNDIDALFTEYSARGVSSFSPPEVQVHGVCEFEISDINGHFLVFDQMSG
jgi:uncharacterized glyoxalase superfamily protein PhnB